MHEEIQQLQIQALAEISAAAGKDEVEALRVKYLGRKSSLSRLFSRVPELEPQQRSSFGKELNILKNKLQAALDEKAQGFSEDEEKLDVTFPAQEVPFGRRHILTAVSERICGIFETLGFTVFEGAEIEDEWHNFTALNIPLDHPSREAFDTFYLDIRQAPRGGKFLLRSHTSPSQVRIMEKFKPPLAVISPGRVYRPDKVDASHSFMFHQIEGFCVDTHIAFSHLKGVLLHFARTFFGESVRLRFRPHFFPFTEPSAEVDVSCIICAGSGCSLCSRKGWLEILGCGMIHPNTLTACGIDPKKYRGFAFGMGADRIALLKYGIHDIRLFYENDMRFLHQFYEV